MINVKINANKLSLANKPFVVQTWCNKKHGTKILTMKELMNMDKGDCSQCGWNCNCTNKKHHKGDHHAATPNNGKCDSHWHLNNSNDRHHGSDYD